MDKENIVEVDSEEAERLIEEESITKGGKEHSLDQILSDIHEAHKNLDEYKQGSLSLSQSLSEAADNAENETLRAILTDMSDAAFSAYLRLHRGDMELLGNRAGKHSGLLGE